MSVRSVMDLTIRGIETKAAFACPARNISAELDFVIDTGFKASGLSQEDAAKIGIAVNGLPDWGGRVASFGGISETRALGENCNIGIRFNDGSLTEVEFPDGFLIFLPSREAYRQEDPSISVSILGMDFHTASSLILFVDGAKKEYSLLKSAHGELP